MLSAVTSLSRSCAARSIDSEAFSTAVTAAVGSLSWPVASACALVVAVACDCSSELIASVRVPPKPPWPVPVTSGVTHTLVAEPTEPTEPTEPVLHSPAPSGPIAPEIAGII